MQKKSMKRVRNRKSKVPIPDEDTTTLSRHKNKNKNKSNKKRSSNSKSKSSAPISKKPSSKKKDKKRKLKKSKQYEQKYKRKQGQKLSSYPQRKLSESNDYNTVIAEPFNPLLIEQQGYIYGDIQHDEKEISKDTYPIEGVSDIQILMNNTNGQLPIKPLAIDSDSDEYNSNHSNDKIITQTNDIIASSEDSISIKDDNELINNGAVTMLGANSNEKIKFNDNISMENSMSVSGIGITMMGSNMNEKVKFKDNIIQNTDNDSDSDIIASNNTNVTMIGSDINEKVKFKSDIVIGNNNNDVMTGNNGSVTMIGSVNDNEKVIFKKYNENNNIDMDGDIIRSMNDMNNIETIMGMSVNDNIHFNNNIEDNKHESDNDDILIGNNETLIGGINENEKIVFNDNIEYNDEGMLGKNKNTVLTDLQNIKNNVINALPDPNISYNNPLHPIHNKKNLYNYADDLSTMYDKSFAMKRSMDNTYNNNKKNNKYKHKKKSKSVNDKYEYDNNGIKKKKRVGKKSKQIMTLKDLNLKQPGASSEIKSKSKIKSKSNGSNIRRLDHDRKSKKSKGINKKKRSWRAFLMRNGI